MIAIRDAGGRVVSALIVVFLGTSCGAGVAEPGRQSRVLAVFPELECASNMVNSTDGGFRTALAADAPPRSPEQAIDGRLWNNVGGLTAEDLAAVRTSEGEPLGYVLEVEGKAVAEFHLERERDVWFVGAEARCYGDETKILASRAELSCDPADSVEDTAYGEGYPSASEALERYVRTRSTWLRPIDLLELAPHEDTDPASARSHRWILERDGSTVATFGIRKPAAHEDVSGWFVDEAAACGRDIIDRPGTVGDELDCGDQGFGSWYELSGFSSGSGFATPAEALEDSLRRRGSPIRVADLVGRDPRNRRAAAYEYVRDGRVVAIFELSDAGTWLLYADEWCAEVADLFEHDDRHLDEDRSKWPGA